jgi:hypothetical protein
MVQSPPSLESLSSLLTARALPPVHLWNPTHCGDSDMRIAVDGTWFHQGTPIGRPALVKLFSTILRREADDSYMLVTPHEKLDIAVDDAPFVAVAVESRGEGAARDLQFRLNTGDLVTAGPDHVVRVDQADDGTPRPYLHVRSRLEALINRPVFYELADLALAEAPEHPGIWSGGVFFPFQEPR